jgi:glycosyltransferase involved in cell wall biosynthesis
MKSEIKKMEKLPVAVIVNTLNDTKRDLEAFFVSVVENMPNQFIVVDGGSVDGTIEIARKYTNEVYVVSPGIHQQHMLAVSKVKEKYLFITETDHLLPKFCIQRLLYEKQVMKCSSIEASLRCIQRNNFLEHGQSIFYELNQVVNDYVAVPTAPAIWETSEYRFIIEKFSSEHMDVGYAQDTIKAELLMKYGKKVWCSEVFAWQNERLNMSAYFAKIINYGRGDYSYYVSQAGAWSLGRKIQSLTHVFRKYCYQLPLLAIKSRKSPIFVPFSLLTAIVRYFGFILAILKVK